MFASGLTPEEYAGRHGHTILMFGSCYLNYRDPHVAAWMRWLGEILSDPAALARCQERFLSAEELEGIRRTEDE
jgi:hypothetical protein